MSSATGSETPTPLRFRKLPVEVEAWQATGPREMGRIAKWIAANGGEARYRAPVNFGPALDIETLEGRLSATVGDWIIRGVQGEFYPCKPGIFEQTYEQAAIDGEATPATKGTGSC